MPIYEYLCEHCGKHFELIQKFADEPLTVHPECGSGPVKRLLSAPALQFKGSGWYVNDYASKPGKDTGKESGESKPAEKKDSSGGESKPAGTTGEKPAATPSSSPSTSSSDSK